MILPKKKIIRMNSLQKNGGDDFLEKAHFFMPRIRKLVYSLAIKIYWSYE